MLINWNKECCAVIPWVGVLFLLYYFALSVERWWEGLGVCCAGELLLLFLLKVYR